MHELYYEERLLLLTQKCLKKAGKLLHNLKLKHNE